MAQTSKNKNGRVGEAVAISAGLAALAAASYYFLGPKGTRHRKELKSWSIKMKGEVIEKLEKLQDITEPVYHSIVDAVAAQYVKESRASGAEIAALAQELKRTWRSIASAASSASRKKSRSKPRAKTRPKRSASRSTKRKGASS